MNMSAIPAAMVISTEAGAQGQSTGQGGAGGNSGFAGVLTQVGSSTPSTVSAIATTGSNMGLLNLPQWQLPLTEGEVGGLLQLLVKQMRYSDKDAAELAPAEEAQYEEVMEQIQALLIAMGMMSQAQTGSSGLATQSPNAADAYGQLVTEALETDRHQAVLKAVAALLDQGDPATRQWFRSVVEPQLTKLQELLSRPIQVAPSQDTSEVPLEQKSQQASLQPTSVIHAGSHLQRLNQWSAPAAALAASQAEAAPAEEQTELTAKTDNGHAITATLQDQVRWQPHQLRPLVAQPVPVAQFADTMSGMVMKQFDVTTVNGISEARISLFPEHLGQVDVKITIVGGQLTAMFTAENGMARELLENSMHQLRGALQQQGLQVERLQVTQSDQPQQQTFQEQRQPGSGQQHASSEQQHKSPRASAAEDSFEEELSHEAIRQELDYGSGINVTA